MSAQPFCAWNAAWRDYCATILLVLPKRDGGWESKHSWWEAGMEKRAANRCQAWISGERIADFPHPPHPWHTYAVFCPVEKACSTIVQAMTCSLHTLFLPHRFLEVLLENRS